MPSHYGKVSRRRFLKGTGAGTIAVGTAGCLDSIGSGSSGTPTAQNEVTIGMAPGGFQGIVADHILEETDILEEEMSERGYSATIQRSWEETALFASGGPDTSMMSTLEAARLATERDMNLASFARIAPMFMGWWVERGGEYDPEETGSAQATMDRLVEEGGEIGIGSWAGGHIPVDALVIGEAFGYTFSEEESDFPVVTADYFALPELVLDGEIATCGTGPIYGVALNFEDGEPQHREIYNGAAMCEELGIGVPPFNNLIVTQEFIENNRGAAEAYIQAWHRGMEWLHEDPMGRVMEKQDERFEQIGVETEAQAEWVIDWGVELSLDNDYPYNYQEQEYTDERIESERNFLSRAHDAGYIPDGWEDRLTHHQISQE